MNLHSNKMTDYATVTLNFSRLHHSLLLLHSWPAQHSTVTVPLIARLSHASRPWNLAIETRHQNIHPLNVWRSIGHGKLYKQNGEREVRKKKTAEK